MKKSLSIIGIFALVMLIAGLNVQANQANTHAVVSISGKVIDQFSDPVANADILINGITTSYTTDVNGNYSIDRISTNSTLTFNCYGYETTSIQITKAGNQDDIVMNLHLSENNLVPNLLTKDAKAVVSISGKVIDQFSDPVANADILINGITTSYTTDANGNYSIDRISMNSTLTFSCYGYETTSVKITKAGNQDDIVMNLHLSENNLVPNLLTKDVKAVVSISGKVIDQFSDPVANANILINGITTSYTTDANGNYSIDRISTNSTLTFSCYGYETTNVKITKAGIQEDILMELSSAK